MRIIMTFDIWTVFLASWVCICCVSALTIIVVFAALKWIKEVKNESW